MWYMRSGFKSSALVISCIFPLTARHFLDVYIFSLCLFILCSSSSSSILFSAISLFKGTGSKDRIQFYLTKMYSWIGSKYSSVLFAHMYTHPFSLFSLVRHCHSLLLIQLHVQKETTCIHPPHTATLHYSSFLTLPVTLTPPCPFTNGIMRPLTLLPSGDYKEMSSIFADQ